jgi:hypothetical protein
MRKWDLIKKFRKALKDLVPKYVRYHKEGLIK